MHVSTRTDTLRQLTEPYIYSCITTNIWKPNANFPDHNGLFCVIQRLTTLEARRLRGDQIEVFKILNGYENIDRNIFFTVKEERRTRGHGVTFAKKQCRLDIRKCSFSQRTVNEWNILSADCVGASSVNIFKNKIDIYLRRAGYT